MNNVSNDSGLDDSAAANMAATRMSWFLAEVDEGTLKNGKPNGHITMCVLHSMDLLEADVADKYMTRIVRFRIHNRVLEARLILAADERKLVDVALVNLSKERRDADNAKHLLVQYMEENGNRLVQKLVLENEVVWLRANNMVKGTPLVKLPNGCIAHVLHGFELRDYLEKVLLHLKARSFDHTFDEQMPSEPMDDNSWLLVQYSPDPQTVVYQLIEYSQTVWREENIFKDVIAYVQLPDSDTVLQSVVISYGQQREPLLAKYEQLKNFALQIDIPEAADLDAQLQANGTAALFARSTLFQRAEERDVTGEHRKIRHSLEQMSLNAQNEAHMIIDAFDMVDSIHKNLQLRLNDVAITSSR